MVSQAGNSKTYAAGNMLVDVWHYRYALRNMILKDFKVRYRNMSLGIAWSVLNPLIMLGVLVVVFSYIHTNHVVENFAIFLLLGMIPFNFFSLCITPVTGCMIENTTLMKKIIFPRIILPVSVICSQTVQLFFQLLVLGLFLVFFKVQPSWHWFWLVPVFLIELLFIFGLGLILTTINVYFRDVQYLVHSILTVMFWFTPIFYTVAMVKKSLPPVVYWIYLLNPLVGCIDTLRLTMLDHRNPNPETIGVALIMALGTAIAGALIFSSKSRELTDKL